MQIYYFVSFPETFNFTLFKKESIFTFYELTIFHLKLFSHFFIVFSLFCKFKLLLNHFAFSQTCFLAFSFTIKQLKVFSLNVFGICGYTLPC